MAHAAQESRRHGFRRHRRRHERAGARRPLVQPVQLRLHRLEQPFHRTEPADRPPVRHRHVGPGPVRSDPLRGAHLIDGGVGGDAGQSRHRYQLRCRGRLLRRPAGQSDDAHRGHTVRAALHVLRDPAHGFLRAEPVPDFRRAWRHHLAGHGAHRARPDPELSNTGSSSRPPGPREWAPLR